MGAGDVRAMQLRPSSSRFGMYYEPQNEERLPPPSPLPLPSLFVLEVPILKILLNTGAARHGSCFLLSRLCGAVMSITLTYLAANHF